MAVALAWQQPTVCIGHVSAYDCPLQSMIGEAMNLVKNQIRQKISNFSRGLAPCAQGVPRTFFTYAPQLLRPVSPLAVFIRTRLLGGSSLLMQ